MGVYSNLYSAVKYVFKDLDDNDNPLNFENNVRAIDAFFTGIVNANATDSVVNLVMFPKAYYSDSQAIEGEVKYITVPTAVGNYTPKNKKLLTFPYTFLAVESPTTQKIYRFEWFRPYQISGVDKVGLALSMCVTANPELACIPMRYKGSVDANFFEEIVLSGYPQLAFTVDSYKAWLAQTAGGATALLDVIGGVGHSVGAITHGNVGWGISGIAGSANSIVQNVIQATKGDTVKGNITGSIDTANRKFGFWFKIYGVLPEYAKIIDDYFSRFGYACRQLKVPATHVRENWTYTRTNECTITGGVPADDMRKICSIFDKGITFWNNPYAIGDYSLSNRPLSELP